jgi:hypothetical protein
MGKEEEGTQFWRCVAICMTSHCAVRGRQVNIIQHHVELGFQLVDGCSLEHTV